LQQESKLHSEKNSSEVEETLNRSKESTESNDFSKEEEIFKWEKVKKKNKSKQKSDNHQSSGNKQPNEVTPTVVGAFFTENDRKLTAFIKNSSI